MSWFGSNSDPLTRKQKLLKTQISQVQKKINRLKKAGDFVDKSEAPISKSKRQSGNPFEQQLKQLKVRPKLFQNPGDEEKFRIGSKDKTSVEQPSRGQIPDIAEEKTETKSTAITNNDLAKSPEDFVEYKEASELKSSLNELINASREEPNSEDEEQKNFSKYLAAGNIEGMQNLQFEKRVDRNRKVLTLIFLAIVASAIYLYLKNM